MACKFVIAGVDVTGHVLRNPTPKVTKRQNERSQATLSLDHLIAIPAQFAEVYVYDRVSGVDIAIFGGVILTGGTAGIVPGDPLYNSPLTCSDFMTFTDWCSWSKTYVSDQTLGAILADLQSEKLAAYGITIDAAQDAGPTFPATSDQPVTFSGKVSDILRSLSTQCDPPRVIRMSPVKALRLLVPGTDAAPIAVSDANPNCQSIEWAYSQFVPANKVILHCGAATGGTVVLTEKFTATGTATSWVLETRGATFITHLDVDGTDYTVSDPTFHPSEYTFDFPTQTLAVGDTAPTPTAGQVLTVQYTADLPFTVVRASGATPVIEYEATDANTVDVPSALLEAAGLLAKLNQSPRTITMKRFTVGSVAPSILTAQLMSVTYTPRLLSAVSATVAQVQLELVDQEDGGERVWVASLSLTETTVYQGSALDQARAMFGGASGGNAVTFGSTPSPVVISGPVNLGGSREGAVGMGASAPTTLPVLNYVPYKAVADFSGLVSADLLTRTAGVQVTLRLRKKSDGSYQDAGTVTPGVIGVDPWYEITFPVTILNGEVYDLEVKTDAGSGNRDPYVAAGVLTSL